MLIKFKYYIPIIMIVLCFFIVESQASWDCGEEGDQVQHTCGMCWAVSVQYASVKVWRVEYIFID